MKGFRSTNIPYFTKIIELFMIVYMFIICPWFLEKFIYIFFYQKNDGSLWRKEKPMFVFRQWVENIATQKQVQPIMYGKKFASDNYQ